MNIQSYLVIPALMLVCTTGARADADNGAGAAPRTDSAATLRQAAEDRAGREGKAVFLEFHASWCIWCRRLNAMLSDPQVKPVWDRYFVTTEVDSMEHGGKVSLENAGWEDLMKEYGATKAGLPYFVFLDPKGTLLADCRDPDNMGYPAGKHDSAAFLAAISKSAPSITPAELSVIRGYLVRNAYGAE